QLALGGEVGDPQALAGGISGFIQGMGRNAVRNPGRSAARLSDIIAEVIKRSPTILGTDITRDIGRLGAAQTAMNMTPEQIFAVYGAAAMRGGPALPPLSSAGWFSCSAFGVWHDKTATTRMVAGIEPWLGL